MFCWYLWLLKDNLCCKYRSFHGPSVSPMHVFVSNVGVVTVAVYVTLCVLQLPCRHCDLIQQFGKGPWKQRYSRHKLSFNNHKYEQTTTLPKFIWNTKRQTGSAPEISWSISKPIPAYNNASKQCLLCLSEKLSIVTFTHPTQLLNKRSELLSKCRHENKFLLRNVKSKD